MKKYFLLLLAATTLTVQAQSAAPAKGKHIDGVLEATEDFLMASVINKQLDTSLEDMARKMKVSGAQEQAIVDKHREKMHNEIGQEISATAVKTFYLENFSEKQLQELNEFFRTETGRALLNNMQGIVTTSLNSSHETVKELSPKLQLIAMQMATAIQELRAEKK